MTDSRHKHSHDPLIGKDEEIQSLAHAYLLPYHIKVTVARAAIIDILLDAKIPLLLHEITKKCKSNSRASVYRTLELFTKIGLVQVINMGDSEVRYEFLKGRKHHHHVICTNCGDLEDVESCGLGNADEKILDHSRKFAKLSHHSLEFFGTCKSCVKN